MMSTAVDDLREAIARLERERPQSRLLQDFKQQLADYEASKALGTTSAEQTYFAGNPVVRGASRPAPLDPDESYGPDHPRYAEALQENPMLPVQNAIEDWLQRQFAPSTERPESTPSPVSASTTAPSPEKP
jgi:hypothetical protein